MKIIEIIRNKSKVPDGTPCQFRVGLPVVEGGHTVAEILYCRDGYSGGAKGRWPGYAIKFVESPNVRVIPEVEVVDIEVLPDNPKKSAKPEKTEADIALPD